MLSPPRTRMKSRFSSPPSRFSDACPSHAKNVYKKRDFKACTLEIFSRLPLLTPRTWIKRGISRPAPSRFSVA